ncbi:MAG: hypothetical protein NT070_02175 [Cyanobacteria bacterium]|nr:hypothetical protein [Cyanobacteriota bacterium]
MRTQSVFFLSALLVLVSLMTVPSFSTEPAQALGYRGSDRLGPDDGTDKDYRGSGRVTV